jgi:hypothetical protein
LLAGDNSPTAPAGAGLAIARPSPIEQASTMLLVIEIQVIFRSFSTNMNDVHERRSLI